MTTETNELTHNETECCGGGACGTETAQETTRETVTVRPAVDVWSDEGHVYLVADVPGASAESVDVTVERDRLTFEALAAAVPENLQYREFPQRLYRRTFRLSDEIDRSAIEANVANGVLRLRLPKAAEAQPMKVSVTAN